MLSAVQAQKHFSALSSISQKKKSIQIKILQNVTSNSYREHTFHIFAFQILKSYHSVNITVPAWHCDRYFKLYAIAKSCSRIFRDLCEVTIREVAALIPTTFDDFSKNTKSWNRIKDV